MIMMDGYEKIERIVYVYYVFGWYFAVVQLCQLEKVWLFEYLYLRNHILQVLLIIEFVKTCFRFLSIMLEKIQKYMFAVCVMLLLQCSLGQVLWDHFILSELEFPKVTNDLYINSETDIRTICSYDLLSVDWNTTFDPHEHSVAFTIEGQRDVTYGRLGMEQSWKREAKESIVQCDMDQEYCKLTLDSIRLNNKILSLLFDKDTNQPALLTARSIKVGHILFRLHSEGSDTITITIAGRLHS
jgi:hypothetical protein